METQVRKRRGDIPGIKEVGQNAYTREIRKQWLAEGRCVTCSKPRDDLSIQRCAECNEKHKARRKKHYEARKARKLCVECGKRNIWKRSICRCERCAKLAAEKNIRKS